MELCVRRSRVSSFVLFTIALLALLPKALALTPIFPEETTACVVTDLPFDDRVDVQAMENYTKVINDLFEQERFQDIDCIADAARSGKTKFASGMWKIRPVYRGLREPVGHPTEIDWQAHFVLLDKWISQRPQSITARIALAWSYISYAWDARGGGFADTVSDSGATLFSQRLVKAKVALDDASRLDAKCPEWYAAMEEVAKAEGWTSEKTQQLFLEATEFEPQYDAYYRFHADYLLPKWYGEPGQVGTFIRESADRMGGDKGDRLYFQLAAYLVCACDDRTRLDLEWTRVQKGFDAIEKEFGHSLVNENHFALMATKAGEGTLANNMFTTIGEQWDRDTWQTHEFFDDMRNRVKQMAAQEDKYHEIEKAAEANNHESTGPQYRKRFDQAVGVLVQQCMKSASDDQPQFDLLVLIDREGKIENASILHLSPVSNCMLVKFKEIHEGNQTPFPVPPHDHYWIKVEADAAKLNASAN